MSARVHWRWQSNLLSCVFASVLSACSTTPAGGYVESPNAKPVPVRNDHNTLEQLAKSDIDRMADMAYAENQQSLKMLMLKLYKRNPAEAAKSGMGNPEQIAQAVFDPAATHGWRLPALGGAHATAAIMLAFNEQYAGDRVLAFIVGIQSMLYQAHGNKSTFFLTDSIDAQNLYNAARNIEIAVWKLSSTRNKQGQLMLVTNEMQADVQNLSFEREFGKVIARTDLLALTLAEKSQRLISKLTQSITTANFLPF